MLWIILKIVVFLLVIAGLTLGAEWLMNSGTGLRVAVMDTEFSLGPLEMALAALLLLIALVVIARLAGFLVALVRFVNGDETAVSRFFERRRKRRGLDVLTEGFVALASGDGAKALAKGRKAEALLEDRTLTNLLIAQAAQSSGNAALSEDYYKRLVQDDQARFVGVQGLLTARLAQGDQETARALAEKALAMNPSHAATQDTLLSLQTRSNDWEGARRTLSESARSGRLPRDVYRRRDAVLALAQAEKLGEDQLDRARDLAIEANTLSPELVPAAVRAAIAESARSRQGPATKILKRAWKALPHPELAQAYAAIAPDETPAVRLARFEKLFALAPDARETRLTRSELLIGTEDFPAARRALGDLSESPTDQRSLTLMAAITRGEGADDAVVRGYLARALTAPRGPAWVCEKCQHSHARWSALCENCHGFDTLSWLTPPDSTGPSATGTEMLPLIVGRPEVEEAEPVVEAEVEAAPVVEEVVAEPVAEPEPQAPTEPEPFTPDLDGARRSGL